jgi:hypothetical protein
MTKDQLYLPSDPVAKDWPALYAQYVRCNERLVSEIRRNREEGTDIDLTAMTEHDATGRALIRCPIEHQIQVGQKMRAVQNLTNIDQLFPNLSHIIVQDIFGLLGIHDPDTSLLPTLHAIA